MYQISLLCKRGERWQVCTAPCRSILVTTNSTQLLVKKSVLKSWGQKKCRVMKGDSDKRFKDSPIFFLVKSHKQVSTVDGRRQLSYFKQELSIECSLQLVCLVMHRLMLFFFFSFFCLQTWHILETPSYCMFCIVAQKNWTWRHLKTRFGFSYTTAF